MAFDLLKDPVRESRIIRRRLLVSMLLVIVAFGLLASRVAWLQVVSYQHYSTLSQNNRVRLVPAPPTRGLIYDRNGVVLAENITAHGLVLTPEQVPDIEDTLRRLGEIVELRPADLERFHELYRRQPEFLEIPLRLDLTDREVARFAVNRHRFPGVEVTSRLIRHYPLGATAAHAIGYVGRITERELQAVDGDYQASSHIGKTGIEAYYEGRLRGEAGIEQVETNAMGRVLRVLERTPPVPGEDLYLTLDIGLQKVAEAALGDMSGAVVALDPRNGEVLAFVSEPGYDPNLFVTGISIDDYSRLQTHRDHPLFNRALRGQYPPGSTFKPFVALAGLVKDVRDAGDSMMCGGVYKLPHASHIWRDWKRWGHGEVDLNDAIAESCDIYFYDLAYELGIDALHEFLGPFGFGQETGIDLSPERTGVLPSREWKRRNRGEPWYHGETVITGIGQGFTLTTPLQLAYATTILANRGDAMRPHLLRATRLPGENGAPEPVPVEPVPDVELQNPEHWTSVIDAMVSVVHGDNGTARAIGEGAPYLIAGKTGTAQVFSLEDDQEYNPEELAERLRDHALFIAFAPAYDPRIVVSVVVENGGSGSGTAAPIARTVIDAWLGRQPEEVTDVADGNG
jgi:penicillin-binding protein 2